MTAPLARRRSTAARSRRRWASYFTANSEPERLLLIAMFVFATLIGAAMVAVPDQVPVTAIILPMVLGGLLLGPRPLPWFIIYDLVLLTVAVPRVPGLTFRAVVTIV